MKKHSILLVALLGACSSDTTESGVAKVDVEDPAELLDPDGDGEAEATVEGEVATLTFELADALPEVEFRIDGTEDGAVLDIVDALSLVVSSPRSGVSVSLAEGELVASPPSGPGEWSVDLADNRKSIAVSWYNETTSGLTMKSGQAYDVVYSVGTNCCLRAFDETTLAIKAK